MDGVSAAASVLAIATAGIQVSLKLIAFADQVGTASKRIQDVGTDVSVTASTLQELSEFMKMPTKRSVTVFYPHQVRNITSSSERCYQIFKELKEMLSKASRQLRDSYKRSSRAHITPQKIELSTLERWKWPFLQSGMKSLQSELQNAKASLTLMLQVAHLRYAQKTTSLNQDEQEDLKRTIVAMKRQQLASAYTTAGGDRGPPIDDSEDSAPGRYPEDSTPEPVLEAWSVKPNTWAGEAGDHFLITPLPISHERILEHLEASPQSYDGLTSTLDSLMPLERNAIFKEVLQSHGLFETSILSIAAMSWTGSHTLFGQVNSRMFTIIVEKRAPVGRIRRTYVPLQWSGPAGFHVPMGHPLDAPIMHEPNPPMEPSPSAPHRESGSENRTPSPHRRRYGSANNSRRYHKQKHGLSEERKSGKEREEKEEKLKYEQKEKEEKGTYEQKKKGKKHPAMPIERERLHVPRQRMQHYMQEEYDSELEFAHEENDDDLIKSLLAQYTNYDPEEPVDHGGTATPPPPYTLPKREPRPY